MDWIQNEKKFAKVFGLGNLTSKVLYEPNENPKHDVTRQANCSFSRDVTKDIHYLLMVSHLWRRL